MNGLDLLIHIHALQVTNVRLTLALGVAVKAVERRPFPSGQLVLGHGLARDGIKQIAALTGETLQVIGHVDL